MTLPHPFHALLCRVWRPSEAGHPAITAAAAACGVSPDRVRGWRSTEVPDRESTLDILTYLASAGLIHPPDLHRLLVAWWGIYPGCAEGREPDAPKKK